MSMIARVARDGITPEVTRPDADRLISGDPVHTTWSVEENGATYCGLWQSTVGKWRVTCTEWEYVHIHSGHSVVTDEAGTATHLRAGDSYILNVGFKGTWEVLETTLKDYVIIG
jgi:hypothetical protein